MIRIFQNKKSKTYQLNFRDNVYTDLSLKDLEQKLNESLDVVFEEGKEDGYERGIFESRHRKIYFKSISEQFTKLFKK